MNNEQVIKYVSENSKNPHAAMMVEQLLTGWDVEFFDDEYKRWCYCGDNATWYADVKYQLVKPKMKPAYRVYRYKGERGSNTQDRYEDGTLSRIGDETQIEWLSDWTEYDQWPTPLVERIAAIDIKAAEWIVEHWDELLECKYAHNGVYSRDSVNLFRMFDWEKSPQDHSYWHAISRKLGE